MTFAEKLRQFRDMTKMSERDLANKCGIAFGTLHEYFIGRRLPSFANVVKICRVLGCKLEAFADCSDIIGDDKPKRTRREST